MILNQFGIDNTREKVGNASDLELLDKNLRSDEVDRLSRPSAFG